MRHPCPRCCTMYLATFDCATSKPSLSISLEEWRSSDMERRRHAGLLAICCSKSYVMEIDGQWLLHCTPKTPGGLEGRKAKP